jgi:hypothetical protein
MQHSPRLQPFKFDYPKIAKSMEISEQQAREQWKHVELNPPEGDAAIQITVCGDHVFRLTSFTGTPERKLTASLINSQIIYV